MKGIRFMKTYFSQTALASVGLHGRGVSRWLAVAILLTFAVGGGVGRALAVDRAVQIHDDFYTPKKLRIAPGDTVQWTNSGNSPHTTTSSTGLWNSGTLNPGDFFSLTFTNVGSFPYFCQVHGVSMSGTINVTTNTVTTNTLFLVNLSGTFKTTNTLGKIVVLPAKSKDLIAECASDHSLNPADLAMVYDLDTDAIEVVRIDDGSIVCTIITFAGGVDLIATDGKRIDRQAFVFWEDSDEANGSMAGSELFTRGMNGQLLKFSFRGSIQFGLHEDEPPRIFQGTFTTGRQFIPTL
jgi:plastocyanin